MLYELAAPSEGSVAAYAGDDAMNKITKGTTYFDNFIILIIIFPFFQIAYASNLPYGQTIT